MVGTKDEAKGINQKQARRGHATYDNLTSAKGTPAPPKVPATSGLQHGVGGLRFARPGSLTSAKGTSRAAQSRVPVAQRSDFDTLKSGECCKKDTGDKL